MTYDRGLKMKKAGKRFKGRIHKRRVKYYLINQSLML